MYCFGGSVLFIFLVYCVVLLCVFIFGVPCCNARCETVFGSSWSPFVCGEGVMSYLRNLCLFAYGGVQHILFCVFVFFFFVLGTICFQFLWIVQFWLPLRYSLTFIFNVIYWIKYISPLCYYKTVSMSCIVIM